MRYVLYHGNCHDGFGAAWSAWRKFADDARYIPVSHGNPPPELPPGSDVLIVDFAYPRATLLQLAGEHQVQVLDHHKTAQADLEGLDFCIFDMNRSGAMLTWNYLFPEERPPDLIRYVEDRDLWRWALPSSQEISAWLGSWPFDFELWTELSSRLQDGSDRVVAEGSALLRQKRQYAEEMCRHPQWKVIGGHRVPVANASVCFSEVGERLCEKFPDAPFAAYYLDRSDGKRQWGLRSKYGFDVSGVAQQYGGGGHAAAAGFSEDLDNLQIR
jgi:uncharacterized protein